MSVKLSSKVFSFPFPDQPTVFEKSIEIKEKKFPDRMFNKRKASGNKTFNRDGFADYDQLISPANNHHSLTL